MQGKSKEKRVKTIPLALVKFIFFACCVGVVPLCMGTLTLLKWRDSEGKLQRFYLVNKVSSRWMTFGYRFDREPDELEALEDEYSRNAKRCWCKVMEQWLGEGGTSEYPTT